MHHVLSATLASARERELRTVARRPAHLMSRVLELEGDAPRSRRTPRGTWLALRLPRS